MSIADYSYRHGRHPLDHASAGCQIRTTVARGEANIRKFPWVPPPPPPKSRIGMVFDAVERALGSEPR